MRVLGRGGRARLARGLRNGLEAEGFAVDVAGDGGEGLWYAQENSYDIILLDIMLPVLNGYKVCQQLRAEGNWTPILMLTAKDGDWDQVEALDTGADDYVHQAVQLRRAARSDAFPAPPRSDRASGGLTVGDLGRPGDGGGHPGGEPSASRHASCRCCEFLMRRAGDVVTKQQILEHVWDFDFEGDPNIVEVYIGRLRRKVDKPFGREDIETLRGSGYRLRAPDA